MSHVPRRNMTLVIGLLESIASSDLTLAEYEALNHLLLNARLLSSAIVTRQQGSTLNVLNQLKHAPCGGANDQQQSDGGKTLPYREGSEGGHDGGG